MSLEWIVALAFAAASSSHGATVARIEAPPSGLKVVPFAATGRVQAEADGSLLRQWPGTYFETMVAGDAAFFRLGRGEVSLRISVDDQVPTALVKPAPGLYRVSHLGSGIHRLRIDVASESQAGPTSFGGFFGTAPFPTAGARHRSRAIEFIGDSYTVGYGNTSPSRQCSEDQVWATTDASRGIAPLSARRFGADYQINAISGRGVVRNYNGFAADTLPGAYPYTLFDKKNPAPLEAWHPQVVIIGLGTNDFSTPLKPGEKWKSRDALRSDFEGSYVRFVQQLRRTYPRAYIIVWATDMSGGEVELESAKVVSRLHQAGESRVGFVPVRGLAFSACNAHPSLSDDEKIAEDLGTYIDAHPDVWGSQARAPRHRPSGTRPAAQRRRLRSPRLVSLETHP